MSLQAEREQCLRDINALNINLKEIEKRIDGEKEGKKPKGFRVWRLCVEPYEKSGPPMTFFRIGIVKPHQETKEMLGEACRYREAFSEDDIRRIIKELQDLIGEK
jgi:hypothetical protein